MAKRMSCGTIRMKPSSSQHLYRYGSRIVRASSICHKPSALPEAALEGLTPPWQHPITVQNPTHINPSRVKSYCKMHVAKKNSVKVVIQKRRIMIVNNASVVTGPLEDHLPLLCLLG